jgi:hypothetical protein
MNLVTELEEKLIISLKSSLGHAHTDTNSQIENINNNVLPSFKTDLSTSLTEAFEHKINLLQQTIQEELTQFKQQVGQFESTRSSVQKLEQHVKEKSGSGDAMIMSILALLAGASAIGLSVFQMIQ